jgi:hypothetical protein
MVGGPDARIIGYPAKGIIAADQGRDRSEQRIVEAFQVGLAEPGLPYFLPKPDQIGDRHGEKQADAELEPDAVPQGPARMREFPCRNSHLSAAFAPIPV